MPENNYEGLISLSDAGIREAESQAKIAQMMAETALKWQEVQHKSLENLGLFLKIKWDAQAHENLHRMVLKSQRRVEELRNEKKRLESKVQWANRLLRGAEASLEGIRQGWLGFYFIRNMLPPKTVIDAFNKVEIKPEAFEETSWAHPWIDGGAVVHPFVGHKDASTLFAWAARSNYYPVFTEAAWKYLTEIMAALDESAEKTADVKNKAIADAEAAALELSKIDWSRLDKPANGVQDAK